MDLTLHLLWIGALKIVAASVVMLLRLVPVLFAMLSKSLTGLQQQQQGKSSSLASKKAKATS
jgi:hypothetical protein